jgi:biopolymer transport protein ExbB
MILQIRHAHSSPDAVGVPVLPRTRSIPPALAFLFLLLCFPAFAQETPPGPSPVAEVKTKTALDYYKSGGSMMHPILLCSIGTIAVLGYAFLQITRKKMMPMGLHQTLTRHMQHRQVGEAFQLCQDNPNSYTNVVSSALLKVNFDRDLANKVSMEQAIMDSLDEEETKQMLWVNYLNVFATIAPMLGLLGTVGGMILSFDQLAAGKSDPSELAGGIGVAMITTAGGLLVGIPAMFFYFFFRNRVMGIMTSIQKNATFLIDVLSGEVRLSGEGAPGGEGPPPVEAEESLPTDA